MNSTFKKSMAMAAALAVTLGAAGAPQSSPLLSALSTTVSAEDAQAVENVTLGTSVDILPAAAEEVTSDKADIIGGGSVYTGSVSAVQEVSDSNDLLMSYFDSKVTGAESDSVEKYSNFGETYFKNDPNQLYIYNTVKQMFADVAEHKPGASNVVHLEFAYDSDEAFDRFWSDEDGTFDLSLILGKPISYAGVNGDQAYNLFWSFRGFYNYLDDSRMYYDAETDQIKFIFNLQFLVDQNFADTTEEPLGTAQITAGHGKEHTVPDIPYYANIDWNKIDDVNTAITNASNLISSTAAATAGISDPYLKDYETLKAYAKYICDNNSYNFAAYNNGTDFYNPGTPDFDPNWQKDNGSFAWNMIAVFDEINDIDPALGTNVVCEGYSKAFQYLLEKSAELGLLENDLECSIATGVGHMWNIVSVNDPESQNGENGYNYIVDVTWMDTDDNRTDYSWFMTGYDFKGAVYGDEYEYANAYWLADDNGYYVQDEDGYNILMRTSRFHMYRTFDDEGNIGDWVTTYDQDAPFLTIDNENYYHRFICDGEYLFTDWLLATCQNDGWDMYYCPDCDDFSPELFPKTEHRFGEWEAFDLFQHVHYCEYCGEAEYEDHIPGEEDETICAVCGGEIETVIVEEPVEEDPVEEHVHVVSTDWSSDADSHWHTCEGCDEQLDKAAHTPDGGVVTKPATEYSNGLITYTCTVCGTVTGTDVIPAVVYPENGGYIMPDVSVRPAGAGASPSPASEAEDVGAGAGLSASAQSSTVSFAAAVIPVAAALLALNKKRKNK